MPALSFTIQDIISVSLAFLLFLPVLLSPGYVVGWVTDLFHFRQRQFLTRHVIAVLISTAVVPILFYLCALFVSFQLVQIIVACLLVLYIGIMTAEIRRSAADWLLQLTTRQAKIGYLLAAGWILFSMFCLIDLQWGTKLYGNVVSLDFATRATLINAITRTGVPPINPSYFPGQPVQITSLYYFWYIVCSVVEQLGHGLIDSRTALIAGDIWCGLTLMALIALYLRIRNTDMGPSIWKTALVGISLLAVSGLDIIPASMIMLGSRVAFGFIWPHGDLEHWNDQITAWGGSLLWAPHHVAALIACTISLMILLYYRAVPLAKSPAPVAIAGMALASAVGLSTWVTVAFAGFMAVWSLITLIWKKDKGVFVLVLLTGMMALLLASPFLMQTLSGGTGGSGVPFAFEVRRFRPAMPFVDSLSTVSQNLVYLLLLPFNYAMELGFFFVVGILWLRKYPTGENRSNPFLLAEITLLSVVVLACSFLRSTVVGTNDFGWRAWLLGQFVLLVWSVDINESLGFLPHVRRFIRSSTASGKRDIKKLVAFMLTIGVLTTVADLALLRSWPVLVDLNITGFPNSHSPDTQLGERTYDGRLAYEFINDELPEHIVIQHNPISQIDRIDRPSGLYARRQFAISYNAPFNVPLPVLRSRSQQVSDLFTLEHQRSWHAIDQLCKEYFIDVLVVYDQDPLWKSLPLLYMQRPAIYNNRHYAVVSCGEFVARADQSPHDDQQVGPE